MDTTALEKYIAVGNNIISLPEIPSGMVYGVPTECDGDRNNLEPAELTKMIISRNQLSVKTGSLNKDTYYVKVPVKKASESAKCNYNDYKVKYMVNRGCRYIASKFITAYKSSLCMHKQMR
ncbi:MAG: hypothetical protein MRZ29_00920 [Oscillospiraceae bacterium]|nr:hypothetical protein [Oscillospiraceae bacterium]